MCLRFRRAWALAFVAAMAMFLVSAKALAVPACPGPIMLAQPDGALFEATLWGDERSGGAETSNGYTVLQNHITGYWEYARRSPDGGLEPSGLRPGEHDPESEGIHPRLRPFLDAEAQEHDPRDVSIAAAVPSSGTIKVPVILATFRDRTPTYQASDFRGLLFGDHPAIATGPGSIKDYYSEVSYGRLLVSEGAAGVQGWFVGEHEHDYYGRQFGHERAAELVAEAVYAADPYIDFSEYDNDGDGYVDVVILVHQGMGAECTGNLLDIWSHRSTLSSKGHGPVLVDGVRVNEYTIQPEEGPRRAGGKGISSIGVFAHEFGHSMGIPDLYDIDGSSRGVGDWCLMGSGSHNRTREMGDTPAHMSAWGKWRLGWVNPVLVKGFHSGWVFNAAALSDSVVQLLPNPGGPGDWNRKDGGRGEYFLIENRYKIGFDAGLPASGLAIWHIDERQRDNSDDSHRLVDLEEADGMDDLDYNRNQGDAGDLYPGSSDNRGFGDRTGPGKPDNAWYDGRNTGCSVRNINDSGSVMTADVSLSYACTGRSYDDMGMLLWLEGKDYFDIRRDYSMLADPELLSLFDAVFINCTDDLTVTPAMASALRAFVGNGGILEVTDWAYSVVKQAFPGYVTFLSDDPRIGVAGEITAVDAKDPSLARYMGEDITTVELDLGYWAVIDRVADGVEVGLTGDVPVDPTNPPRFGPTLRTAHSDPSEEPGAGGALPRGVETLRGKPLVVSFPYGKGSVIYASPHLHAQRYAGAPEPDPGRISIGDTSLGRLATWNTLAAITGSEALDAARAVKNQGCSPTDKVIDSIAPSGCLEYEIDHATGGAFAISAATSHGTVEMTAYDPEGRVAASAQVGHAPVTVLIPEAVRGRWILQVRSPGDDESNIAFVACIGESVQSRPELVEGEVRFGPNPANTALYVYYSLSADADLMVYDVVGRMVYSCRLSASDHQLVCDLTTECGAPIANGLYLVVARSEGKTVGRPFRLVVRR